MSLVFNVVTCIKWIDFSDLQLKIDINMFMYDWKSNVSFQ